MLHPAITVKHSLIQGYGLFALSDIAEGEVIWSAEEAMPRYSLEVIQSWPLDKQQQFFIHSMQLGPGWYTGPETAADLDPSDRMNHSCDPNVWFADDNTMTAQRLIQAGEEVTFDYAMSEIDERFVLACRCGSPQCRGTIRGSDYRLIRVLQERYKGHVMSHVLASI